MIATVLFGLCFILGDVAAGGHSNDIHVHQICYAAFQCIKCHHCNHMSCPPRTKLTCYPIVNGGGGDEKGIPNGHVNDCACQPEDYCDEFYPCHNLPCPDSGFIPHCNIWNHTCTCVHRDETCSGSDVRTCKITNCNSQEKLYCDHGFCSCKSLNYCNQNNADCANHSCKADLGESPFCNVTRCQCAVVVDTCQGSDTSNCRHLNCNGQFMHQICSNGVCQCQLNPSCSSSVECTETNTAIEFGANTQLECKSQYGLFTDCENGRCQCFQSTSSTTTALFTVSTTTATTQQPTTTRSIITQQQTSCSSAAECTETNTAIEIGNITRLECKSQYDLYTDCRNGTCQCFPALNTSSTTTFTVSTTTATHATTGPATPTKVLTTTQPIPNTSMNPNGCVSRSDCDHSLLLYEYYSLKIPCPAGHEDCVNNTCFCQPFKVTTPPPPSTSPTQTTAAPSISCHQCGDPDANLPCDLRTVYMGQPSQCLTGSYCMTDVVQGSDGSVAIYKRCVDELTCRNEWMAQSSDQDRCLRYAESPVPGQYTCHYCCTVDGCNSKIVPDAKYFYSSSASINN